MLLVFLRADWLASLTGRCSFGLDLLWVTTCLIHGSSDVKNVVPFLFFLQRNANNIFGVPHWIVPKDAFTARWRGLYKLKCIAVVNQLSGDWWCGTNLISSCENSWQRLAFIIPQDFNSIKANCIICLNLGASRGTLWQSDFSSGRLPGMSDDLQRKKRRECKIVNWKRLLFSQIKAVVWLNVVHALHSQSSVILFSINHLEKGVGWCETYPSFFF